MSDKYEARTSATGSSALRPRYLSAFPLDIAHALSGFGWVTIKEVYDAAVRNLHADLPEVLGVLDERTARERVSRKAWEESNTSDAVALSLMWPEVVSANILGSSEYGDAWDTTCNSAFSSAYQDKLCPRAEKVDLRFSSDYRLCEFAARAGVSSRAAMSLVLVAAIMGTQTGAIRICERYKALSKPEAADLYEGGVFRVSPADASQMLLGVRTYVGDLVDSTCSLIESEFAGHHIDETATQQDMLQYIAAAKNINAAHDKPFWPCNTDSVSKLWNITAGRNYNVLMPSIAQFTRGVDKVFDEIRARESYSFAERRAQISKLHDCILGVTPYYAYGYLRARASSTPFVIRPNNRYTQKRISPTLSRHVSDRIVRAFNKLIGSPRKIASPAAISQSIRENGHRVLFDMIDDLSDLSYEPLLRGLSVPAQHRRAMSEWLIYNSPKLSSL